MMEAGIGRGGGGVIVVVVYRSGRSLQTDGDEQQGGPTKIHGGAVVGMKAPVGHVKHVKLVFGWLTSWFLICFWVVC